MRTIIVDGKEIEGIGSFEATMDMCPDNMSRVGITPARLGKYPHNYRIQTDRRDTDRAGFFVHHAVKTYTSNCCRWFICKYLSGPYEKAPNLPKGERMVREDGKPSKNYPEGRASIAISGPFKRIDNKEHAKRHSLTIFWLPDFLYIPAPLDRIAHRSTRPLTIPTYEVKRPDTRQSTQNGNLQEHELVDMVYLKNGKVLLVYKHPNGTRYTRTEELK